MITIKTPSTPKVIIQGKKFLRIDVAASHRLKVVQSNVGVGSGGSVPDDLPDFTLLFDNKLI